MKKYKVVTVTYFNQLEDVLNRYAGKEGYELVSCVYDTRMQGYTVVLVKEG